MNDPFLNTDKPKTVAIYIRVSTQEQKIDGYGLEAQKKKLLEYVHENKNLNLHTTEKLIYCDVHTGSDINRPELQKMLKDSQERKFEAILVWKIDRLSRSLKHLLSIFEELEKNKVSFISAQENIDFTNPIGKLVFQMFGAIAQFERELIKGRTKMGIVASAEMGNYTGSHIPFGYTPIKNTHGKGKKLKIIPDEREIVQNIFHWYVYEELGYGLIANKLNSLGISRGKHSKPKKDSSKWTPKIVRDIIKNDIYRGLYIANKTNDNRELLPEQDWTVVKIPKCVNEFIFMQAQKKCFEKTGGKKNTEYMLSGKLYDVSILPPKKFSGAKRHKGGYSYRRKQFDNKSGKREPVFEFPAKQLDDYAWERVTSMLKNPQKFIKRYLQGKKISKSRINTIEDQLDTLRGEKAKITEMQIPRIESAYEEGSYSEEKMREKITQKNKKLSQIEKDIQRIEDELSLLSAIDIEAKKLQEISKQVKFKLENLSPSQKKIICDLFIDRIEMNRSRASKNEKWQVNAEISFRFNPEIPPFIEMEGRTSNALKKTLKGQLSSKSDKTGGPGKT